MVCSEFRRVPPGGTYLREIIFFSNPIDFVTRLRFLITKDNEGFEYPSVSMLLTYVIIKNAKNKCPMTDLLETKQINNVRRYLNS